jgi:hypothetical protein
MFGEEGGEPGTQVAPVVTPPHFLVMLEAIAEYMSGIRAAFDLGLLQPLTVPAAVEVVAPPLWPLQSKLVLECIEHPDKLTLGLPLKVIDTSEVDFP